MKKLAALIILAITILTSNINTSAQCISDTTNIYKFEFNGHSYEIVKENLKWVDAAACAVSREGYLVEINSKEEQDTLYNHILSANIDPSKTVAPDGGNGSYLWTGANDIATNGVWIWDGDNDGNGVQFWQGQFSGNPVDNLYNNWGDEPDFQDAVGIAITNWPLGLAGQWNDVFAKNELYYIIEKDQISSGIDNIGSEILRIFPNPANEYFSTGYQQTNIKNIEIINLTGQTIKIITNGYEKIDLKEIKKGTYLVSINLINGEKRIQKLTKQ